MPEIPEIRAHAERLTADFAGAQLAGFRAMSFTALKTFHPAPEVARGERLESVGQRAKYLMLDFGVATFVVHLMQGGRLRPDEKQSKKPRGGLARWSFDDGRALLLTEPGTEHRAGVWVLEGDPLTQEPIAHLGPEATDVDEDTMLALWADNHMRLHGFLRDQRIVSGLGRRLANEICYEARLSPFAQTSRLSSQDARKVVEAIATVVETGLKFDRSQSEMSKSAARPSVVHGRSGERCPDCDCEDEIRNVEYRQYTVSYCPVRQTGGKVLADNTTSRFLK
jgi:formamidopyrimidine-DNA glycosylase